jgi:FkbM family methyltransferase
MHAPRFVSYAQNFEDVMLWRALRHVPEGFYVDVGADDPVELSVTKAFSDRGWRGINLEPVASQHAKFVRGRPRDVNLRLLAGSRNEPRRFFAIGDEVTGCSTTIEQIATGTVAETQASLREETIQARTLDSILAEHHGGEIHFLKIDVEGAEADVLAGLSLDRHRPWIIVLESMAPRRQVETHASWEPGLLAARYEFVYADGLNRFYLAAEHAALRAAFTYPPNVFDDFVLAGGSFQCGGVAERLAAAAAGSGATPASPGATAGLAAASARGTGRTRVVSPVPRMRCRSWPTARRIARTFRTAVHHGLRQPGKLLRFAVQQLASSLRHAVRQPGKLLRLVFRQPIRLGRRASGLSPQFDFTAQGLPEEVPGAAHRALAAVQAEVAALDAARTDRAALEREVLLAARHVERAKRTVHGDARPFAQAAPHLRAVRRGLEMARGGPRFEAVPMPPAPRVSIVINTLNRCEPLRDALESLRGLRYSGQFEVIVVNGPSTDGTAALLQEWSGLIRVGRCPVANISISRNEGIRLARGEIVAFIDDDAVVEPDWLERLVEPYRAADVAAVGGHVIDHTGRQFQWAGLTIDRHGNCLGPYATLAELACFPGAWFAPHLPGVNCSFRRDVLLAIGGFDEEYEYGYDEADVCMRVMDAGHRLVTQPAAIVHHKYAPSHLRTEARVWRSSYALHKNRLYFGLKHASRQLPEPAIVAAWQAHVEEFRRCVATWVSEGRLPPAAREEFETDVIRAFEVGRERARAAATSGGLGVCGPEPTAEGFLPFASRATTDSKTILLVSHDFPPVHQGGIATYVRDLAAGLAAQGHAVHVVCSTTDAERTDYESGVWVHRIVPTPHELPGGFRPEDVPAAYWNWSMSALREAERIAARQRIDVVEAPIWSCQAVAFLHDGRWPVVVGLQTTMAIWLENHPEAAADTAWMSSLGRPTLALERWILERAHGIRSISRAIRDDIEWLYDLALPRDRTVIAPLGLGNDQPAVAAPRREDDFEVLFVGRLEYRKGIDVLLEAVPLVIRVCPQVRFRIVGDDSIVSDDGVATYRKRFEAGLGSRLPRGAVTFTGSLPDADVRRAYEACDLFVAPSRYASFGLVFLEAMRAGRPVIGCAAGGMPEIIQAGQTGLLVPPGDAAALAAAIVELVNDPARRERFSQAGRTLFEQEFTAGRMAEASTAIYGRAWAVHAGDRHGWRPRFLGRSARGGRGQHAARR